VRNLFIGGLVRRLCRGLLSHRQRPTGEYARVAPGLCGVVGGADSLRLVWGVIGSLWRLSDFCTGPRVLEPLCTSLRYKGSRRPQTPRVIVLGSSGWDMILVFVVFGERVVTLGILAAGCEFTRLVFGARGVASKSARRICGKAGLLSRIALQVSADLMRGFHHQENLCAQCLTG